MLLLYFLSVVQLYLLIKYAHRRNFLLILTDLFLHVALLSLQPRVTSIAINAAPKAKVAWRYAKAELAPPRPSEFGAVQQGFRQLISSARKQRWKHLTIRVRHL